MNLLRVFYFLTFYFCFVASNSNQEFAECCQKVVSSKCAKHCKFQRSIISYSWPFLKGDCDWNKERDALRQCFMKEHDQIGCCKAAKIGRNAYDELCLEICDGTRKSFSQPIGKYIGCKRFLRQYIKCAKSS